MQLTTFLSAAAAVATVSARNAVELNKSVDKSQPQIRIINRCNYNVNLWSVLKAVGCDQSSMVTLKKGEAYTENLIKATDCPLDAQDTGVSIKISKTEQCKGNDIAQVEYYMDNRPKTGIYANNFYDMSYVDCVSDCPTKQEGFYWKAGTDKVRALKATADNSWCPILSCGDSDACAKISYILPDDTRTKTCDLESSHEVYLCGSQAPSADDEKPASSAPPKESAPKPSVPKPIVSSPAVVKAAAVTPAPEIKDAIKAPVKVKTEIVYVTAIEYVNAKRHEHAHAHAHARRHQQFHA